MSDSKLVRVRWAAIGAAVAVTIGAGGFGITHAMQSTGERGAYTAATACRLLDTRPATTTGGRNTPLGPGETLTITATGPSGQCLNTPPDVIAVELNITALNATAPTHLTVWATGNVPNASSLNPRPGQPPTPNAVTTRVHTNGTFKIFNNAGTVDLLVDLVGYYRDHNHDDRYYTRAQSDAKTAGRATCAPINFHSGIPSFHHAAGSNTRHFDTSAGASGPLHCSVTLPVGATITRLQGSVIDPDVLSGGPCRLFRVDQTTGAVVQLLATPGSVNQPGTTPQVLSVDAPPGLVVSANDVHHVECRAGGSGGARIVGVIVTFTR